MQTVEDSTADVGGLTVEHVAVRVEVMMAHAEAAAAVDEERMVAQTSPAARTPGPLTTHSHLTEVDTTIDGDPRQDTAARRALNGARVIIAGQQTIKLAIAHVHHDNRGACLSSA